MDLWAAFAAAGAEYLGTHKQESSKSSGVGPSRNIISSSAGEESEVKKPSDRQVVRAESRRRQPEGFSSVTDGIGLDSQRGGVFLEKTASSSMVEGEIVPGLDEYMSNKSTLLSLQPWVFRKESYHDGGEGSSITSEDQYPHGSSMWQTHLNPRNVGPDFGFGRSRSSLRSRRARRIPVKPLTCVDNSLIPQMYNDHFDFEEFHATPFPSPASPPVRPFVVTDGRRIISKSSSDQFNVQTPTGLHHLCGETDNKEREQLVGDQGLQPCRPKRKCEEADRGRVDSSDPQPCPGVPHLPEPVGHALFFCLGVSVGVMSSLLSSKREVDKLNDLLKQRENLVQDLQEELTMKDSLSVSELAGETRGGQELKTRSPDVEEKIYSSPKCGSTCSSPKPQQDNFGSPVLSRGGGSEESLSKIEAELEAELEKLELNINATSLEGRLSTLAEVEPDFVGDIVHGELRVDVIHGGSERNQPAADSRPGEPPANYAVSPRQLSLRLHELIQSQLEDRIKELEAALSHSQMRRRRHHLAGADRDHSLEGVSDPGSPTMAIDQPLLEMSRPLCLNLSGDALEAYHEAYEEFQRSSEAEEEETVVPSADNWSPAAAELSVKEETRPLPLTDNWSTTAAGLPSAEEENLPLPMADNWSTTSGLLSAKGEESLPLPTADNWSTAVGELLAKEETSLPLLMADNWSAATRQLSAEEETLPLPMAENWSTASGQLLAKEEMLPPPMAENWSTASGQLLAEEMLLPPMAENWGTATGQLLAEEEMLPPPMAENWSTASGQLSAKETLLPMADNWSTATRRLSETEETLSALMADNWSVPTRQLSAKEAPASSKSSEQGSPWSVYGLAYDDDGDGGGGGGDDEEEEEEDEEGRMLIQRILERARKGSPVVQNAQRMLSLGAASAECSWDGPF